MLPTMIIFTRVNAMWSRNQKFLKILDNFYWTNPEKTGRGWNYMMSLWWGGGGGKTERQVCNPRN